MVLGTTSVGTINFLIQECWLSIDMAIKTVTGPKSFTIVRTFWVKYLLLWKAVTAMVDQKVIIAINSDTNGIVKFIGSAS